MECFGIDVGDDELMQSRTGRWLKSKVMGLLERPPTLVPINGLTTAALYPVFTTRIQRHFLQVEAEPIQLTS